mmetsp:Transcript_40656/g.63878  ORF Transcript_40656/g.63878 Transcript_40656/m.63878 type:complete len:365 (+) Transcript_40656:221-1315(+)
MAAKGASICGAIKFSIVPTIIRHVAADHVGIPAIVASAVCHVATDHICIPINVRASGFVVMIVVDVDNGRTLHIGMAMSNVLRHMSHDALGESITMPGASATLGLVRAAPALLRTGPTVFPVLEARVAVIDVFHLDVSGSVDHLVLHNGFWWQRHRDLDHLSRLFHRHWHWHRMVLGRGRLWHRHVVLLMNVLRNHMRMSWHGHLDHLGCIMNWNIHNVVDDSCGWCWNWHMHWHGHVLDVGDGVVVWPISHLRGTSDMALVAAVALVLGRPLAFKDAQTFGAVVSSGVHIDLVRNDPPRRWWNGHRHHVWHMNVLHVRVVLVVNHNLVDRLWGWGPTKHFTERRNAEVAAVRFQGFIQRSQVW